MKPGQGKNKGSSFEREVGYTLSKWLTKGERDDLFCRTVLSGGQFTVSERGNPGDLMGQDPIAYELCKQFVIECKHWADLDFNSFLRRRGLLYQALIKLENQARGLNLSWFFIVKQNFMPALVMTPQMPYHDLRWPSLVLNPLPEFTLVELKEYLTIDPSVVIL